MIKKITIALFVLSLVGLVLPATSFAQAPTGDDAADAHVEIVHPGTLVDGKTYSKWTAKWWKWNLSMPVATNPTYDTTGERCGENQKGDVFFLAGIATGEPVERDCTIPAGKYILFPMINVECSNVEQPPFYGDSSAARLECAQAIMEGVDPASVKVTVDGNKVRKLSRFHIASTPFRFTMPADDNILGLPNVTKGRANSDGYWLMLTPLEPGEHTLHFEAAITSGIGEGFTQDVTYNLTVSE